MKDINLCNIVDSLVDFILLNVFFFLKCHLHRISCVITGIIFANQTEETYRGSSTSNLQRRKAQYGNENCSAMMEFSLLKAKQVWVHNID